MPTGYTNGDFQAVNNLGESFNGSGMSFTNLSRERNHSQVEFSQGKEGVNQDQTIGSVANWQQSRETSLPGPPSSIVVPGSNGYASLPVSPPANDHCGPITSKTSSLIHERQVLADSRLTRATNIQSTSATSSYSTSTCPKLPLADNDINPMRATLSLTKAADLSITATESIAQDTNNRATFYTYNHGQEPLEPMQQQSISSDGGNGAGAAIGIQYSNNMVVDHHHHHLNRFPLIEGSHLNANISDEHLALNTTQSATVSRQQQLLESQQHVYQATSEASATHFMGYPLANSMPAYENSIYDRPSMASHLHPAQRNSSTCCSKVQPIPMPENQEGMFEHALERFATGEGHKYSPTTIGLGTSFDQNHSASSPIKFPLAYSQQSSLSSTTTSSSSCSSISSGHLPYDNHLTDRSGDPANHWAPQPQQQQLTNDELMSSSSVGNLSANQSAGLFSRNEPNQQYEHQHAAQTGGNHFAPPTKSQPILQQREASMIRSRYSDDQPLLQQQSAEGADYMMQSHRLNLDQQPIEGYGAAVYHQKMFDQATPQFPITY